jgi:signal transduction histidine kinase
MAGGTNVAEELDPKTISGLLGLFAHDLRNPLSALHSNVGFLAGTLEGADADTLDALRDALVSCDGLVTLIDNLELFSQSLLGAAKRAVEVAGVAGLVAEVMQQNEALANSHEANLSVDPALASSPSSVRVHRDMFRRAVGNLVRNGIQHSSGGTVRVTCEVRGPELALIVADTGPELPPELAAVAFSAVGQLTVKGRSSGRYGRGLGLFCARYSAEAAGARLGVEEPPPGFNNAFVLGAPLAK